MSLVVKKYMIDNGLFFTLSLIYFFSFEHFHLYMFGLYRIYKFSCDLLLALLGFMGDISNSQFIYLLEFLVFDQYFTLTVSLIQWPAAIGTFNCHFVLKSKSRMCNMSRNLGFLFESLFLCFHYFENTLLSILMLLYVFVFLRSHGDTELNPGPKKSKENALSVCHWNLNSITAHDFSKLTQLKAYISTYKYHFICLSETYLDSTTPNNLIDIEGYNLVCADHPDDTKRGGVCIYYKESLPVRVINLPFFNEALLLEMSYKKTKILVSVIYRSPSQNEFNLFSTHLENLFSDINNCKPFLSVVTGDFNARSSSWWPNDINTSEGTNLFSLASSNGFSQLINEPTHIQTSSSSCLDLIFTDQPNLSINSGVHPSLHSNCHHQIVHSSVNLNIHYPPPYQWLTWDYKKADSTKIRQALESINWERLFHKKDLNAKVIALNETILNVFRNYVPNKYISVDDKDPVWMNETLQTIYTKWQI